MISYTENKESKIVAGIIFFNHCGKYPIQLLGVKKEAIAAYKNTLAKAKRKKNEIKYLLSLTILFNDYFTKFAYIEMIMISPFAFFIECKCPSFILF